MKKILLVTLLLLGLCGCDKKQDITLPPKKDQELIIEKEPVKEEHKTENKEEDKDNTSSKKEENNKEESQENVMLPDNNQEQNDDKKENDNTDTKEELPTEETNKKIVVCTTTQTGTNNDYYATLKFTTTFENNTIVYHTMYIEKSFYNGTKAEDDKAFEGITNEKLNSLNDGRTGSIYIKDNTIYYTLNFDIKNYPKIISYVTSHTEYEDFLDHMTNNNGYTCY